MNRRHLFALAGPLALAAGALATGAQAQTQAPAPSKGPPNPLFAEDDEFWFETVRMFGADEYGAGSFGEVLAVSCQIKAGDYDSWYDAWNAAGERLAKEGDGQLARGAKDAVMTAHGEVVVVDRDLHRVCVFSADGSQLARTWGAYGLVDGAFARPVALAIAGSHLYVRDADSGRVQVFQ